MHRYRLRFRRGERLKYLGLLDLGRAWERGIRRAALPLAYSSGFTPHPRISIAAPLPVGVTSECELMDIVLERPLAAPDLVAALNRSLPSDLEVFEAFEVPLASPPPQSLVRFAEYRVVAVWPEASPETVRETLRRFLAAAEWPWVQQRDRTRRQYDLRRLVDDIWIEDGASDWVLGMRLRQDSAGAGRAEQVLAALGFPEPPIAVHRRRLVLAPASAPAAAATGAPRAAQPEEAALGLQCD